MTRLADLSPNHPVMVCSHVADQTRDVLALAIDEDARVSLDCGDPEHGPDDWQMQRLGQVLARDPALLQAPALTPEEYCERAFRGGPWWRATFEDEGG